MSYWVDFWFDMWVGVFNVYCSPAKLEQHRREQNVVYVDFRRRA